MKRLLPVSTILLLTVLLASCGQQADLSLRLGSGSGSVVRGDHVKVPVTVSHATGPVSLSVSGVPSGVSATLAKSRLSGGAASTTLDIRVSAAASNGNATVTVNAVQGSKGATATFRLTITSLTVTGSVVDILGQGMPGATVAIQGTTTTSDASGSFTIGGVAVPYDVIVKQTVSGSTFAQVFEGLTSATPELNPDASVLSASLASMLPMSATITGHLSSAVAAGYTAAVCAQSGSTYMSGCTTVAAGSTAYSITAAWAAGSSIPVTVYAVEVETDAEGFATAYGQYGTASGTVANGGTPTIDVAWGGAVSGAAISSSVNVPAGFYLSGVDAAAGLSASDTLPLFQASGTASSPLPSSPTVDVPQMGTGGYTLIASADTAAGGAATHAWKQGVGAGGSATISLPTPPTLTAPADGATGIGVGSTMSLSSANGAATFHITGSSQHILVTTMSASITIPDLSSVGMALTPGASYTWHANVTPMVTTPEDAASSWMRDFYLAVFSVESGGSRTSLADGSITVSASRSFTAR